MTELTHEELFILRHVANRVVTHLKIDHDLTTSHGRKLYNGHVDFSYGISKLQYNALKRAVGKLPKV